MKSIKHILTSIAVLVGFVCQAQNPVDSLVVPVVPADSLTVPQEYSDIYLDTVKVDRVFKINDYSDIGVEYGVSFNRMTFNPPYTQTTLFVPNTFGVFYTRYGKMFGYLPYFGFKVGLRYSHEGYKFKENKDTQTTPDIEGATQAIIDVAELPFMATCTSTDSTTRSWRIWNLCRLQAWHQKDRR